MNGRGWVRLGALSGFLAVAAGAFGAHGLEGRLEPRRLANFETAARYQMVHALALVAVGLALRHVRPSRGLALAGWGFLVGTVLFSGSLYLLAVTGQRWLGMVTPLGGIAFLVGWMGLAVGGRQDRRESVD